MMSVETLAALLDDEIERAIERLRSARRDMKREIAALEAERERRGAERKRPPEPSIDVLAERLRRPDYYMHVPSYGYGGYEKHKEPPKDRPSLAIVEIDGRWQFTATRDDSRGRLVYPPAIFPGHTDWDDVGRRDGSTFFRRDRKWRPPPPEVPLLARGRD
jgi:hypothetical protein